MGFLKLLLNSGNAEGIREAMRISYRSSLKQAKRGDLGSDFAPHLLALLNTMGSRMAVNNLPADPTVLWHEIAPFGLIRDEEVAVEALAEYAVFVERTVDTKLMGLRETLNSWIRRTADDCDLMEFVSNPYAEGLRWYSLLDDDVKERLAEIRATRPDTE